MLMLKTIFTLCRDRAVAVHNVAENTAIDARTLAAAALSPAEALAAAGVGEAGLTDERAAALLAAHGPNTITSSAEKSLVARLIDAFATPFNGILFALAAISLYTDVVAAAPGERDPWTVAIILAMMGISGALQFAQESRGQQRAQGLAELGDATCTVVREGRELRIRVENLVPGDVMVLTAGDVIAADARVLRARDLAVNESALTGESAPVEKRADAITLRGSQPAAAPRDADTDHITPGQDVRREIESLAQNGNRKDVNDSAANLACHTDFSAANGASDVSDLTNVVFKGTAVESGHGLALVTATGDATYLGHIAATASGAEAPSAFDAGVAATSRVLVTFMLVMVPIVFAVNLATKHDALAALLFSASVAVGITPQMLPMIVTACLSRGAGVLTRAGIAVKELSAIQNLGAMDVLCCDKTGTLTEDRVVLDRELDVRGRTSMRVLALAFLNSWHQTGEGNPVDAAVVERVEALLTRGERSDGTPARALSAENTALLDGLREGFYLVDELPFDFTRRRMSVVVAPTGEGELSHAMSIGQKAAVSGEAETRVSTCENSSSFDFACSTGSNRRILITKGAVEEVLTCCDRVEFDGKILPLDAARIAAARQRAEILGNGGLRVIAVAWREWTGGATGLSAADEQGMILAGFIALLDPPRESAAVAVAQLQELGVDVKVLTGDAPGVAASACERVGIAGDAVLTGRDVDALDDAALAREADCTNIFTQLTPLQKARIVRVLREQADHTVGFMGDGINDAAALTAGDAGISVAGATAVARDAADLVMTTPDPGLLAHGVREGRRTYGNLIKYIKLTASGNFGNVFSVLAASVALPFLPMDALQLVALSLITELVCATLPWDTVDAEFCARPRAWRADGIARFMRWMGPVSSVFDIATFAVLFWVVCPAVAGGSWSALAAAGDADGMAAFVAVFQTGWFVESLWTQALAIHALRGPGLRPAGGVVGAATLAGCTLGTALPWTPIAGELGLTALPIWYFGLLAAVVLGYLALVSLAKRLYIRRHGELL